MDGSICPPTFSLLLQTKEKKCKMQRRRRERSRVEVNFHRGVMTQDQYPIRQDQHFIRCWVRSKLNYSSTLAAQCVNTQKLAKSKTQPSLILGSCNFGIRTTLNFSIKHPMQIVPKMSAANSSFPEKLCLALKHLWRERWNEQSAGWQTYKVRTAKVESRSHLKQSCRCSLG